MKWSTVLPIAFMFFLVSCGSSQGNEPKRSTSAMYATLSTELTEQEKKDLLFMWEEEKMARDVYTLMYQKYGSKVFGNIKSSEQKHMDSVKKLLNQVNLPTPVDENEVGAFTDPDIKELYEELLARGYQSKYEAFKVGLDIELTDIEDLTTRIQNARDPGIIKVYEVLRDASYNHKAAFERQLGM